MLDVNIYGPKQGFIIVSSKNRVKGLYDGSLTSRRIWKDIEIGGYSGGLLIVRYPENLLHEGFTFRLWRCTKIQPGKSFSYIFKTNVKHTHLFWQARGIYDCKIETYGWAEVSDYGESLGTPPITNGNHNSKNTTKIKIYEQAEIENDGRQFSSWRWYMPDKAEAILAPNVNYHMKYKNKHSDVNYINLTAYWFEQESKINFK